MKTFVTLLITCLFPFALAATSAKTLGKGAKGKVTHSISDIAKAKGQLAGQFVRVKGKITDVCPMKGCWVELQDLNTGEQLKVKVEDDVIVFPKDSKGKTATVEGRLVAKNMSHKKAIRYFKHLAEEKGQSFDPKSVTGPVTIYEIEGTGAELQ